MTITREKARGQIIDLFLAGGALFMIGFFFIFLPSNLISAWGQGLESNLTPSQMQLVNIILIVGGALLVLAVMLLGKAIIKLYDYKKRTRTEPLEWD